MKFPWATSDYKKAKFVLFGVPDESGSKAPRSGSKEGPNHFRRIANYKETFTRKNKKHLLEPSTSTFNKKLHDYGNVRKKKVQETVERILKDKKIPVMIGGDHSNTLEVLSAYKKKKKEVKLIYFDAHPDIVCSTHHYYGSVVCDFTKFRIANVNKSMIIGTRTPEAEEFKNIKKLHLKTISPWDIQEKGVEKIFKEIKRHVGKNNIYLSIDLDVLDPAFAPGVNTPAPAGLTPRELMYLTRKIAELGVIGMDITELSAPHDVQGQTAHIAVRTVLETLNKI